MGQGINPWPLESIYENDMRSDSDRVLEYKEVKSNFKLKYTHGLEKMK